MRNYLMGKTYAILVIDTLKGLIHQYVIYACNKITLVLHRLTKLYKMKKKIKTMLLRIDFSCVIRSESLARMETTQKNFAQRKNSLP